jgi:SAM-dependent methyltransferase
MKLNLGCGDDVKPGYTNVDFRQTQPSVLKVDLSTFPWPFEDESADEILMLDFLEHFPYGSTPFILLECFRILSPDGTVAIQVPDGDHLVRAFGCIGDYTCNRCEGDMYEPAPSNPRHGDSRVQHSICPKCGQTDAEVAEAAMRRMYGGQDYTGNYHQTLFTMRSLAEKAKDCGLELVGYEEERHQYVNWNFKARFKKADLW